MTDWKKLIDNIKEKLLGQERISQMPPGDPNNKYACLFTCYYMFLRHVWGYRGSWHEYKRACMQAGALRKDFYVLNHTKMLRAVGCTEYTPRKVTSGIPEAIIASIVDGRPVICSLDGEHWVSIDGWRVVNDELVFTIDDPGYAGDWYCTLDLRPYRLVNGARHYQTSRKQPGQLRRITSIMVMDRNNKT